MTKAQRQLFAIVFCVLPGLWAVTKPFRVSWNNPELTNMQLLQQHPSAFAIAMIGVAIWVLGFHLAFREDG